LVAFMVLSAVLSMFIDSITVLLFLATVTVELARLLKFDPVPVIIAEIFTANVGGAATMSGDPRILSSVQLWDILSPIF